MQKMNTSSNSFVRFDEFNVSVHVSSIYMKLKQIGPGGGTAAYTSLYIGTPCHFYVIQDMMLISLYILYAEGAAFL